MTAEAQPTVSAAARYDRLTGARSNYVIRAREVAALTIPSLFPPSETPSAAEFPSPYHSLGARGVNNLASKLLLAMLPPGTSFFRLKLEDDVVDELEQQPEHPDDVRGELEAALAKGERRVMSAVESGGMRPKAYQALRQLIVAGNVLLNVEDEGRIRYFRLDSYVVVRDGSGNVLEIVVKERLDRETVPDEVRAVMQPVVVEEDQQPPQDVDLYTRIVRRGKKWHEWQEVDGREVPKTRGTYPLDKSPWLALCWNLLTGENYGRGFGEEQLGDLSSLDSLTKSLIDFAAVASRIVFLCKDGGVTSIDDLVNAVSGEVVPGDPNDVGVLQLEKFADFQVTANVAKETEGRLSASFLLNTAVQRQAERVTAEEIRYVANELEQTLGGIYSVLAQELQLPLAALLMAQLTREGKFPRLPKGAVKPTVVTGLAALGRTGDAMRLQQAVSGLSEIFGPQVVAQHLNPSAYIRRIFTAYDVETDGLVRTDEEVQAQQTQQMQADLVGKLGPEAMRQQAAAAQQGQPGAPAQAAS